MPNAATALAKARFRAPPSMRQAVVSYFLLNICTNTIMVDQSWLTKRTLATIWKLETQPNMKSTISSIGALLCVTNQGGMEAKNGVGSGVTGCGHVRTHYKFLGSWDFGIFGIMLTR